MGFCCDYRNDWYGIMWVFHHSICLDKDGTEVTNVRFALPASQIKAQVGDAKVTINDEKVDMTAVGEMFGAAWKAAQ